MKDFQNLKETKVASREIFQGNIVHLFKDDILLPNGKPATREVIRHVGAVAVVPLTDDGKVIVERQFRYPIDRVATEIPAGKLDSAEEDRLSAAKRELEEETGYTATDWLCLGDFHPTFAYCDEMITLYLARGLQKGTRHLDPDEFLNIREVPLEELVAAVMDGKITDGKTQTAILKTALLLNRQER